MNATDALMAATQRPIAAAAFSEASGPPAWRYLIGSQAASQAPLPPQAELAWWYQFYFATDRGQAGYGKYRRGGRR